VILFRRIADLERKYVLIARALAIREAQELDVREPPETDPDA
jgi:hypothetical protein